MGSRVKPDTLLEMKGRGEPITMLTCYDYPTALRQEATGVDVIFVGDSVGVNVLGYDRPQQVTMEDMIHHTRAVRRGVKEALLVSDMPFASYDTPELAVANARRFVEEGAEMVKVEGGREIFDCVSAVLGDGIPVMGHVGFTPQTSGDGKHVVGAQGEEAAEVYDGAHAVEEAGGQAVVLECVPERVGEVIAEALRIPTIGIGSGRRCDGQVLVTPDLLGWSALSLRFAKRYADLGAAAEGAFSDFVSDVKARRFPTDAHRFRIKKEELRKFKGLIRPGGGS